MVYLVLFKVLTYVCTKPCEVQKDDNNAYSLNDEIIPSNRENQDHTCKLHQEGWSPIPVLKIKDLIPLYFIVTIYLLLIIIIKSFTFNLIYIRLLDGLVSIWSNFNYYYM